MWKPYHLKGEIGVGVKSKDRKGRRRRRGTGLGSHNNGPRFICMFTDHPIIVFLKRKHVAYQFSHTLEHHPPPSLPCIHPKMASVNMLSDDSDSGEDINQITVNEHYAKAYAYRKERQELERREYQYRSLAPFTISKRLRLLCYLFHARTG